MLKTNRITLYLRLSEDITEICKRLKQIDNHHARLRYLNICIELREYVMDLLLYPKWYQKFYSKTQIIIKLKYIIRTIGVTKPYHMYGSHFMVNKINKILEEL